MYNKNLSNCFPRFNRRLIYERILRNIEYYKFASLLKSRGVCLYEFIEEETDYLYYSRNSLHHDFFLFIRLI